MLGEVRSLLAENVRVMALTATATQKSRMSIRMSQLRNGSPSCYLTVSQQPQHQICCPKQGQYD